MPFTFNSKNAGDLIRSQDWNDAMAAIEALYGRLSPATGHGHTGTPEDGPRIGTNGLADLAVTMSKLGDLSVANTKLQDSSVTGTKIAPNSVNAGHIQAGAVGATQIAASAVGTTQLANLAVNTSKLADLNVTTAKIADLNVSTAKLANQSVDGNKLANLAVNTNHIVNGAVSAAKLAPGVVRNIGVTVGTYSNGQTAVIPSGFTIGECVFAVSLQAVIVNVGGSGTITFKTSINSSTGVVTCVPNTECQATVIVLARTGGWAS